LRGNAERRVMMVVLVNAAMSTNIDALAISSAVMQDVKEREMSATL